MKEHFAIGLMSGTSLDGLDICYVKFTESNTFSFEILAAETISYSEEWKQKLQNVFSTDETQLFLIDIEFGKFLGSETEKFIQKHHIKQLDFIASHGHTIFHEPEKGITVQIGLGDEIAKKTAKKVVYDFRIQDVELGGQGAPLVPIGDKMLFSKYEACLNLGGFANISFEKKEERIAFDVCPVNIVLNVFAQKLGLKYDDKGNLASKGNFQEALFQELNKLEFYHQNSPKSLGLEWVNEHILPLLEGYSDLDILRTFSEHIAFQIYKTCSENSISSLLISGGGVYNEFIINVLKDKYNLMVEIPSKEIIEFKEALIFAFMGLLKLQNKDNVLASVTGAKQNHSSGKIVSFWV